MNPLLICSLLLPARAQDPAVVPDPGVVTAPVPTPSATDALVATLVTPPAAAPPDYAAVLGLADALARDGDHDAARAVAGWVAQRSDAGPAAEQARRLQQGWKGAGGHVGPTIELVATQAAFGAWLLGGNPAYTAVYGYNEAPYYVGALVGGVAGITGALLLSRQEDFGPAHVGAMVGPQVLMAYNGAVLGTKLRPNAEGAGPAGLALGAVAGTGLGVAWNLHGPDDAVPLGLPSGAAWGLGLTLAGLSWTYAWDRLDYDDVPTVLLVGTDIGAAVGAATTALLPINRQQVAYFDAGGALGAGLAYAFARTTAGVVWYAPHDVAALVGGAGVVGGALGFVLATRLERVPELPLGQAVLHVESGRPSFAVPLPQIAFVDGDPTSAGRLGLQVALVNQEF